MEKRRILLPTKRFFNAPEEELNLSIQLDESQNLLRQGDKEIILDIAELYKKERDESKKYKIYGKIKMVFKNLYYGTTTYDPLLKQLFLVGDGSDGDYTGYVGYNEFSFLRNDVLKEINIVSSGSNLSTYTPNIALSGTEYTGHTTITPITAPYQNWNLYLSYVHDKISNYQMKYTAEDQEVYTFNASDGILFEVEEQSPYYKLTSPMDHGMAAGEYVTIDDETFYIDTVGDEKYNSEKRVINILMTNVPIGFTFDAVVFGKRCLDIKNKEKTTSVYYVHKLKTITDVDSYILDKIGFETPIWEDEKKIVFENGLGESDVIVERNRMETLIYDIKEPFVLTGITNNLGYTPTEIYLTTIFRNKNGYFNYPPKVGYNFNFHDTWIDEHFDGSDSNEDNLTSTPFTLDSIVFESGDEVDKGTSLIGSLVEYNPYELRERIVSDAQHKITFNVDAFDHGQTDDVLGFSGATESNPFGLFYKPFHRIKLRELSTYVEKSDVENIINLPENAKYFEDEGVWKWRDVYDHGYIDSEGAGVNHPFVNGIHYVKTDINFYLRNEATFKNKQNENKKFNKIDC
jgi:hypothetical protein